MNIPTSLTAMDHDNEGFDIPVAASTPPPESNTPQIAAPTPTPTPATPKVAANPVAAVSVVANATPSAIAKAKQEVIANIPDLIQAASAAVQNWQASLEKDRPRIYPEEAVARATAFLAQCTDPAEMIAANQLIREHSGPGAEATRLAFIALKRREMEAPRAACETLVKAALAACDARLAHCREVEKTFFAAHDLAQEQTSVSRRYAPVREALAAMLAGLDPNISPFPVAAVVHTMVPNATKFDHILNWFAA